jgi:regulatory protein
MARRARPKQTTDGSGERPAPDLAGAVEIALHYLGPRPRTRWEVARRLQRAGCDEQVLEAALGRLTDLGYLDDLAFARWWRDQRDRHAPRGERLLGAELRQRGVPREVIEELASEPGASGDDEGTPPADDDARARDALDRHLRGRSLPTDRAQLQRLGSFLMRRGFDAETVRRTLRAAAEEID